MPATQKMGKSYEDKKVQLALQIHIGVEVYVNWPQLATFASDPAEEFAWKDSNNLIRPLALPYIATEAPLHTRNIDEDGTLNRVAKDRVCSNQKSS